MPPVTTKSNEIPAPTELTAVTANVWRWSVWNEPRSMWFNGHLLLVGNSAVLVDPVAMSESVVAALRAASPTVMTWLCVLTNRDHVRAVEQARTEFTARVLVPKADATAMQLASDRQLEDEDVIANAIDVVAVAGGKSPGELALYWRAKKLLVLGDAAVGKPAGGLSMLPDDKFADITAARAGVAALAELGANVILVGDGDDILDGGAAALGALGNGPKKAPAALKSATPGC